MTSNFDSGKNSKQASAGELDSLQRDRFEVISAYLDGEVTAAERSQVREWLDSDPDMQRLYARLMKLRQGLQHLPTPAPQTTPQQTVEQVFARLDRRRMQRVVAWSGAAIAALFVSAITGIVPGNQSIVPQLAQNSPSEPENEPLMIAVNRPVIVLPKASVASPEGVSDSWENPSNNLP